MKFETIIAPGRSQKDYWKELLGASELFWILAKRDITVRYKQTILGFVWSIIRPALTAIVLIFAFGKVARLPFEPNVPPYLSTFAGVLIWNFFANSLSSVSNSIVNNANLVSKTYFPRLLLPMSSVMVSVVDFFVGCILLIPMYIYANHYQSGFHPSWQLLFLPFFVLLAYLTACSFGLILAVLNVKFRDFSQITPFIIQFGFYACPVGFSVVTFENKWWYPYYNLNPVVGLIDGFRWTLLGGYSPFRWESLIPCVVLTLVACYFSVYFFRKRENAFVDYI